MISADEAIRVAQETSPAVLDQQRQEAVRALLKVRLSEHFTRYISEQPRSSVFSGLTPKHFVSGGEFDGMIRFEPWLHGRLLLNKDDITFLESLGCTPADLEQRAYEALSILYWNLPDKLKAPCEDTGHQLHLEWGQRSIELKLRYS